MTMIKIKIKIMLMILIQKMIMSPRDNSASAAGQFGERGGTERKDILIEHFSFLCYN